MARSIRSNALEARTNRLKLGVARKPAWVRIGDGLSLGYRRNQTAGELRRWRDGLAKKIAPASVNRTCRGLKAALNAAADRDKCLDRHAWTIGLALIPNAERAENIILPPAVVAAIVAAARRQRVA